MKTPPDIQKLKRKIAAVKKKCTLSIKKLREGDERFLVNLCNSRLNGLNLASDIIKDWENDSLPEIPEEK